MLPCSFLYALFFIGLALGQQIYDSYITTWDRSKLFTYLNQGSSPVNFATPGPDGTAIISIQDDSIFQQMDGFGASLTDSSAGLLSNMKVCVEKLSLIRDLKGLYIRTPRHKLIGIFCGISSMVGRFFGTIFLFLD
jgi:hypothetical protein